MTNKEREFSIFQLKTHIDWCIYITEYVPCAILHMIGPWHFEICEILTVDIYLMRILVHVTLMIDKPTQKFIFKPKRQNSVSIKQTHHDLYLLRCFCCCGCCRAVVLPLVIDGIWYNGHIVAGAFRIRVRLRRIKSIAGRPRTSTVLLSSHHKLRRYLARWRR